MGHTLKGRPCEDRWRYDAAYSKLPYFPKKIAEYPIGDMLDWNIRPYVLEDPYITSPKDEGEDIRSPEIYDVDECVENPDEYFNNVILKSIEAAGKKGAYKVLKRYTPRTLQTQAAEKVVSRWNGETIINPLAIDPRLGKDYTQLDIFYRSGLRIMISPGGWLSANASIVKTIKERSHITADITTISPDPDELLDILNKGGRVHIDWSLHGDNDNIDSRFFEILKEWDAYIACDEADHTIWTENKRPKLYEFINSGNNLVTIATGTNIERALIGLKGTVYPPIQQTYLDALELKRNGDPTYQNFIEIACLNLDANQAFIDNQNDLSDEDRFNMKKLFKPRNSHVQRTWVKQNIFDDDCGDDLFGVYVRTAASLGYKMPIHLAGMVWFDGTKKDLDNLANVIRSIASHINVIVLHGDIRVNGEKMTNRIAERIVKDSIKNTKCEKTVILSCGMGSRSFSVPNVVWSMDCLDGGSFAASKQRALRMSSPGKDKQFGLYINYTFNPNRISSFETDLMVRASNKTKDNDSTIRRVHGLVNFLKDKDTFRSEVDYRKYINSPENLVELASSRVDYGSMESDEALLQIMEGVKKSSKSKNSDWDKVIKDAKTYIDKIKSREIPEENDKERKALNNFRTKVYSIIKSVGNISYLVPDGKSFGQCLEIISQDSNKDKTYENMVGLPAATVLEYFYPYFKDALFYLDGVISNNKDSGLYNDFKYIQHPHVTRIFDIEKACLCENVLYFAKEPGTEVLEEIEKINKYTRLTVVATLPGYLEFYKKKGYNVITLDEFFSINEQTMNFDYVLVNPPFSNNKDHGTTSGSGNNALWWQITKKNLSLLKPKTGILDCISPSTMVNGADTFTERFIGKNRQYDLKSVDFTVKEQFKVGIPLCHWILNNTKTDNNKINVTGYSEQLDSDNTYKIMRDEKINSIFNTLFASPHSKLNFNTKGQYHYDAIKRDLKKKGLPLEWATDLKEVCDEDYCYPVNINGTLKYSRAKGKMNGTWRVFYPQLQDPTEITVDNKAEAGASTFTMVCDSEESANLTKSYLETPVYRWLVDMTRASGRVSPMISSFPNAFVEDILNEDQLSFINSQIK